MRARMHARTLARTHACIHEYTHTHACLLVCALACARTPRMQSSVVNVAMTFVCLCSVSCAILILLSFCVLWEYSAPRTRASSPFAYVAATKTNCLSILACPNTKNVHVCTPAYTHACFSTRTCAHTHGNMRTCAHIRVCIFTEWPSLLLSVQPLLQNRS